MPPLLDDDEYEYGAHLARCPSRARESNHASECRERYFDDEIYRLMCYACRSRELAQYLRAPTALQTCEVQRGNGRRPKVTLKGDCHCTAHRSSSTHRRWRNEKRQ